MKHWITGLLFAAGLTLATAVAVASDTPTAGRIVDEQFVSSVLRDTRTGLNPARKMKIYLPPGYASSGKSYPAVYFCHSIFQSPEQVLADGKLVKLIEQGVARGLVKEFILVIGDYTSPTTGSVYENTAATGRWLDYTVEELVPYVDGRYRTLRRPEGRALVGEMMGGRGALQLAMRHPQIFSAAYALNPVGTGTGLLPIHSYPNWQKIHAAKSIADLAGEHISQIFVTFSQAFLPNPNRPPFYCDFLMEMENGELKYHAENARKLIEGFSLSERLEHHAENLSKIHIAFDWSRYDPIQDHVYAVQAFTRKLETFGVEHEAEEYRGVYWTENWKEHGRFQSRVLPFLARYLAFAE